MKNKQKKVVIVLENDFRDEEAIYPFYRLQEEGFMVEIATDEKKQVFGKFGVPMQGTIDFKDLNADEFEGVIVPGGNEGPDKLRMDKDVLKFVKHIYEKNKMVAAICHGVWVLISANIIKGKKATCYRSIIDDVKNAGGLYTDEPVVVDGNIITSRHPRDLAYFSKEIIKFLGE